MASYRCPGCDELKEIVCTGERQKPDSNWTSMWWTIVVHKHPKLPEICEGSGKRV